MEAVQPSGGDQVLQRPPIPPPPFPLPATMVWPSLMGQALGPETSRCPRHRPWLQARLQEAGVQGPSGTHELSWVPKLRHASDHKHVWGGGQSLFLESSKAGDFSGLVQPLAHVPLAPSRATVSCTQATPTDDEAHPPSPSQSPLPHKHILALELPVLG